MPVDAIDKDARGYAVNPDRNVDRRQVAATVYVGDQIAALTAVLASFGTEAVNGRGDVVGRRVNVDAALRVDGQ
jgi:hypothetical protein